MYAIWLCHMTYSTIMSIKCLSCLHITSFLVSYLFSYFLYKFVYHPLIIYGICICCRPRNPSTKPCCRHLIFCWSYITSCMVPLIWETILDVLNNFGLNSIKLKKGSNHKVLAEKQLLYMKLIWFFCISKNNKGCAWN